MLAAGAIAAAVVMLLSACGSSCHKGAARATIEKYIREGVPIKCENRKAFKVRGRTVYLEHVEYGEPADCPSGCYYSDVCTIRDGDELFLLTASWGSSSHYDDSPIGIHEECPDLQGASVPTESCTPSGLTHPVTYTAKFQQFMHDQMGSGPFRFCVDYRIFDPNH